MNDETYEFEDRIYVSPTISRDEQLAFINNLRSAQDTANQQIETQTRNLGTQVPLNQGGLTSGATDANSYWMSRYQTPQVNQQVANLQEAAQRTAMNQVLKNMADQMTNRYNQAYQDLQRRQYDLAQRKYDLTSRQYDLTSRQYEQSKRHYLENQARQKAYTTGGSNTPANPNLNAANMLGIDTDTLAGVDTSATPSGSGLNIDTLAEERKMVHAGPNNTLYYKDYTGEDWQLEDLNASDQMSLGLFDRTHQWPNGKQLIDGTMYTNNFGNKFLYVQNSQYPNGQIFKVRG